MQITRDEILGAPPSWRLAGDRTFRQSRLEAGAPRIKPMPGVRLVSSTTKVNGIAASIQKEADWYVAQCLEVDVASQGKTEQEALKNLKEALELHFEPPTASMVPLIESFEVDISAA